MEKQTHAQAHSAVTDSPADVKTANPVAAQKKKTPWKWIIGGCCGCLVVW
ncbi:MAG: hypothetical protein WCP97_03035 [bacterium]